MYVVFFSLVAIGAGLFFWRRANRLFKQGMKTQGIIIDHVQKFEDVGYHSYYPVILFTTEKNVEIRKRIWVGTNPKKPVGQTVTVYYDPNQPDDSIAGMEIPFQIAAKIVVIMGSISFVLSIVQLLGIVVIIP